MDLVEGKLQKFVFIDVEGLNNKAFLEISAAFASDRETRFSEFLKKFPAALVVDHVFKSSDEMDSADEVVGGMVEAGMIQNIERVSGVHELFKTLQSMDGNIDGINAVIAHLQVEDLDAMEMQEVYEKILGIDDILVMVSERNQQILAHDQQDSSHLSSRNTIPSLKFERFEGLEDSVDAANATVLNGKYGPYYMTPNILSGILMSLLLVLFLICAINVTLGIKTPTRFPHKPLVIKKEF